RWLFVPSGGDLFARPEVVYLFCPKHTKLETLIATYDILLDLRPRLPDPNFRMINLPVGDTAIDKVPTNFNQNHTGSSKKGSGVDSSGLAVRDEVEQTDDEPHGLDTSILGRVADHTTSPAPVGTAIPRASPKEIIVTRPDHKTGSSKKGSGVDSSGLAVGDEVEQTDDGTLDDDDQRGGLKFAMKDIGNYKKVRAHAELSGGMRRATRASFYASHAPNTQPLDVDADGNEIVSDGNVDPCYETREEIYGVNLGLRKKKLYKDPKVCRTALDRFPTPAETHRLREISLVEFFDRMSVLQCQLITHGSMLTARYDHPLRNVEHLSKQCAQQTHTIKRQCVDFKQQNESTVRANEEVSKLTAKQGVLKSRCQMAEHKLSS
nr:hypothetical protein [Tanacetum cinerariifolium]